MCILTLGALDRNDKFYNVEFFREIVRLDKEDNQELFRQYLSEIVHSVSFNLMTMVAIVLNFLSIYVDVILQGDFRWLNMFITF